VAGGEVMAGEGAVMEGGAKEVEDEEEEEGGNEGCFVISMGNIRMVKGVKMVRLIVLRK